MRLTTLISAAVLGLSSAALAQVASPTEQKVPDNGAYAPGNDMPALDNQAGLPDATDTGTPSSANAMAQSPDGDPTQASSAPPK